MLWSVQHTLRGGAEKEEKEKEAWANVLASAPICASTGKHGYGLVHAKHPFARFAQRCLENYQMLVTRGIALAHEHTFRMGTVHSAQAQLEWLRDNPPPQNLFLGTTSAPDYTHASAPGLQDVPICVPEDALQTSSVVKSYRRCYRVKAETFRKPMRWTRRRPPKWLPRVLGDTFVVVKNEEKVKCTWQVVALP